MATKKTVKMAVKKKTVKVPVKTAKVTVKKPLAAKAVTRKVDEKTITPKKSSINRSATKTLAVEKPVTKKAVTTKVVKAKQPAGKVIRKSTQIQTAGSSGVRLVTKVQTAEGRRRAQVRAALGKKK